MSLQTKNCPPRDWRFWNERIFAPLRLLTKTGYFPLEVKGHEKVPKKGPVIYVANHTGWFTADSLIFTLAVNDFIAPERIPYAVIHDVILKVPGLKHFFENLGVVPASWLRDLDSIPREINAWGFYPEGDSGNCRPIWNGYQMTRWHTGFIRLALAQGATIVPTAIIGGIESFPVVWDIKIMKRWIGTRIPVPLTLFPLPTNWKVVFHRPIRIKKGISPNSSPAVLNNEAQRIRMSLQKLIDKEVADRPLCKLLNSLNGLIPNP
jgi:1-acyl-sn-glycerol-3-phosphate acyltransferase